MMIDGFNIRHALSVDMRKWIIGVYISKLGRKIMRWLYRIADKWSFYGQRPRGDIRHDLFYARTGHNGQPFVLLDKNEDVPRAFLSTPTNLLKLWELLWGNICIADDTNGTVLFCMRKYRGMCSTLTYPMVFAQKKEMGRVFTDMEAAKKATTSLFRFNKKISSLGGKK
jgi:hypothetical protein